MIVEEFEAKISSFYGANIRVVTIAMEALLCSHERELENVVICLEPV